MDDSLDLDAAKVENAQVRVMFLHNLLHFVGQEGFKV